MRIVFDAQWISDESTGIGKISLNWIKGLLKYELKNNYLLIGRHLKCSDELLNIMKDNESRIKYESIPFPKNRYIANSLKKILWEQLYQPSFLKRQKYDLLHYLWFNIPFNIKGNVIITIHDMDLWINPERYSKTFRIYYKGIVGYWVKRAKAIVTVSECSKKDIISIFKVSPRKVHVVYNFIDLSFFAPKEKHDITEVLRRYNIENDYILYPGGIGVRKNLDRLLEAYTLYVNNTNNPIKLIIIGGDNEITKNLKDKVRRLKVFDKVYFPGYIQERDMPYLYSGARVVVYMSLYEGFGLPIIEAMACGIPVITSNLSSMPEISGNSAIHVDPFSVEDIAVAIDKVCNDTKLQNELKIKGKERVSFFSEKNSIEKLIQVYKSIDND